MQLPADGHEIASIAAAPPALSPAATSVALGPQPLDSCERKACSALKPSVKAPPLTQFPEDVHTMGPGGRRVLIQRRQAG